MIHNRLYQHGKLSQSSQWPRLAGEFHGSGCTLASAIAAGLAQGLSLGVAITRAEVWLHEALKNADKPHAVNFIKTGFERGIFPFLHHGLLFLGIPFFS